MRVKTSELSGVALDWAVAKCEGVPNLNVVKKVGKVCVYGRVEGIDFPYQPSTDWSQGGPIIEREKVALDFCHHDLVWFALIEYKTGKFKADNPLVAAMRCYVASKLGDTVEVPDELF